MRTILIGDIHGCYDEFIALLKKSKFNKDKDRLIILGDFIDKGPKSFEIIDYLAKLKKEIKDRLVIIEGNHEYQFLYTGYNLILRILLFCLGRNNTKKSFKNNNMNLNYYDEFLLNNMQDFYEDDKFQTCHASIKKDNIKDNSKYTLVVNRLTTYNSKYKGKLTITGHLGLGSPLYFPGDGSHKEIKYDVECTLPETGIICIDTACYAGNKLTAMIIEDNKYILTYVDGKKD